MDLNGDLQRSGNALTEVMRQQVESRTTLDNIDEAIETLKVYPFASGVLGSEWAKQDIDERRVFTGATLKYQSGAPSKPIFLGFMTCIVRAASYCKPGVKIHFILDSNPQTQGWSSICYSELKRLARSDRHLAESNGRSHVFVQRNRTSAASG